MAARALDGIKVFEVSQIVAGPFCGVALADLGADVVKVEAPGGEGGRQIGAFMPGESKGFHTLNRGKRSLVIDLAHPEGQALVHQLIAGFDVFLINARPSVPGKLHLDYETLRRYRPDLIYIENTGFGDRGPSADRSGSDIVAQAYSGLAAGNAKTNEYGAPLQISGTAPADVLAAISAAMGVCAALFHRERTGEGQKISTSLLQAGLALQAGAVSRVPVYDALVTEKYMSRVREARARGASYREILDAKGDGAGTSKAFRLYYGGYAAKDGGIILGALTPLNRDQFRRALGVEDDPTRDPDFNALDPASDAIAEAMAERIRGIMRTKTMDEWIAAFDAVGAPASKVNFAEDMSEDPQVQAMEYMLDLEHALTGPERIMGPVVKMSKTPTGAPLASPPLGAHTDEVLSEHGVSAEEIARLREAGVVC